MMDAKEHAVAVTREGQMNIFEADYQARKQEETNMIDQAKEKLQAELKAEKVHPYVSAIGNFLMDHIKDNPGAAEKIMAKDKTILGSMKAMSKEAAKHKVGNCAVLTDEQGFGIVLKYFGITGAAPIAKQAAPIIPNDAPKKPTEAAQQVVAPTSKFTASLDEFL